MIETEREITASLGAGQIRTVLLFLVFELKVNIENNPHFISSQVRGVIKTVQLHTFGLYIVHTDAK